MRVLVLGSGGFIGSHLSRDLTHSFTVFTAKTRSAGKPAQYVLDESLENLGDVLADSQPDIVVNCTGSASVANSFESRTMDFEWNVVKVQKILETIRRRPGTRFIHLSSAAVYGNPSQLPIREDLEPSPISPYGWHKLQAETICRQYSILGDVPTISLRVFSVFGPEQRKQLFWDVYSRSLNESHLIFHGTGKESRDYIYISDFSRAVQCVIENACFDGSHINVGNGEQVMIQSAVAGLLEHLEWKGTFSFSGRTREGDPLYWEADVTRLKKIGYSPLCSFSSGVRNLAKWMNALSVLT